MQGLLAQGPGDGQFPPVRTGLWLGPGSCLDTLSQWARRPAAGKEQPGLGWVVADISGPSPQALSSGAWVVGWRVTMLQLTEDHSSCSRPSKGPEGEAHHLLGLTAHPLSVPKAPSRRVFLTIAVSVPLCPWCSRPLGRAFCSGDQRT